MKKPKRLTTDTPRLEKTETSARLIVDGKPFLILGGELQNSSALKHCGLWNGLSERPPPVINQAA